MTEGSVTREGGFIVIRIPEEDGHSLRVALEPCPCKAAKSAGTLGIRQRLSQALARLLR